MKYKIIYTADIHGVVAQYNKLINYSNKTNANTIIIGGDIAPKEKSNNYIQNQRNFLQNDFPEIMSLKNSNSKLYIMMGNDDCSCNLDVLEERDPKLYSLINKKRLQLTEDFDIVGYSYVPITPFRIKDWEKFDLSSVSKNLESDYRYRKLNNYNFDGIQSIGDRWRKFRFTPKMEKKDSIQRDLADKLFTKNPDKTLYIIHTPPNNTNLDRTIYGENVGSFAVREFIEKHQPYLTLHGHIHETVRVSKSYKEKIGNTLCMTSGNNEHSDELVLLEFDLFNQEKTKRKII